MSRRRLTPLVSAMSGAVSRPSHDAAGSVDPDADPDATVDVLARTLWGEARGEPVAGIEAVAAVVVNRARIAAERGGWWWGTTIKEVCLKPWQFSCWNADDPNRHRLLVAGRGDLVFETCVRIARRAVLGLLADPTGGATHYHAIGIHPYWAEGRSPSASIGRHLFYRDVE